MGTINNIIQNLAVWKRETAQTGDANNRSRGEKPAVDKNERACSSPDLAEFQTPLRHAVESNQASSGIRLNDLDEAQDMLHEVIDLMGREYSSAGIHSLNQGNIARLLTSS